MEDIMATVITIISHNEQVTVYLTPYGCSFLSPDGTKKKARTSGSQLSFCNRMYFFNQVAGL